MNRLTGFGSGGRGSEGAACQQPNGAETQAAPQDHARNIHGLRSERHAHADFTRALRHRMGQHSVNADAGEHQRQSCEDRQQDHRARAVGDIGGHQFIHGSNQGYRLLRIHGPYGVLHCSRHASRFHRRAHQQRAPLACAKP